MSHEQDMAKVADMPSLDRARMLVDHEIASVEEAERKRIFHTIRNDTLDPQTALQAWLRLEALDKVRNSLVKRERQAQSASERVAPDM